MIFYGINPVIESLRSQHRLTEIYLKETVKNHGHTTIRNLAKRKNIVVRTVTVNELRDRCGTNEHQGVAALIDDFPIPPLDHIESASQIVLLDGLQDPHNFGAAIRVCEVFGIKDIVFHTGNSCGVTAAAIKASAGAIFHCKIHQSNLNKAVKWLKHRNYSIVVLDGRGDELIHDLQLPEKICVVVGSEGLGVRHTIMRQADCVVSVPMKGMIESLNVSCALTAALYEFTKNQGSCKKKLTC